MNLISNLKNIFTYCENQYSYVDVESRRRFLKGAAGLATIAAVSGAGGLFRVLNKSENERLLDAILSGIVEGQTFILDRTAFFFGISGVKFIKCCFIADQNFIGDNLIELDKECKEIFFDHCVLKPSNEIAGSIFKIYS